MRINNKKLVLVAITIVLAIAAAEIALRMVWGLGSPLLYEAASDYGYRVVPKQNLHRFGKHIFYNAQGLRNSPVTVKPAPGTLRILCVGDSITYGGVLSDQQQTYPYLLQQILRQKYAIRCEVLNAAAGGWALANEYYYLRHFGIFHSHIVVWQIASHDLFQEKMPGEVVGKVVNYPHHNPWLALEEGLCRYFIPRYLPSLAQNHGTPGTGIHPAKQLAINIEYYEKTTALVRKSSAKLLTFLIEQPEDLEPQVPLYKSGKKMLARKSRQLGIAHISLREIMHIKGGKRLFRDAIHPNEKGNQVMAEAIAAFVYQNLESINRYLLHSK